MVQQTSNQTDPSQNYIAKYPKKLDALFHPSSIAVIGAKDNLGSVGRTLLMNLLSAPFRGKIFPVNPKRKEVLGLKSYPSILEVPQSVDLAIIVTPAVTVPAIIADCVKAGVKTAIIISAGFKEMGEAGQQLENEILFHAQGGGLSIIGPNCLGIMNPGYGLNASFAKGMALPGNLAFISQSGAMCTAVLDWSLQEKIGFSAFVSIGSMADVNWGTLIDYLGNDPFTHSLLLYMETVGDARSFMTAAREVALEKPIIVIKSGRTQAAAQAAASHTGSLAGSDDVFDAALERIGVLRVDSIGELFSMASVLSRQPRPKGSHLTILTNAGGPAVLATDATVLNGAQLTALDPLTIEALNAILPAAWSHQNPVDMLGEATSDQYIEAIKILNRDPKSEGILAILSPQDMTDATATAEQMAQLPPMSQPLLASWMGGKSVQQGKEILSHAQIPVFNYPDDAAKIFALMWRYSQNLQTLYETPSLNERHSTQNSSFEHVQAIIKNVQQEGRTLLTEFEAKQILKSYHIPIVETEVAYTLKEAIQLAEQMGFPLVLKIYSKTITHKTDIGGVKLDLKSMEEVEQAFHAIEAAAGKDFHGVTVQRMIKKVGYELILGSSTDPQFGPLILFGMGGQLVEVLKDRALAIPPLNKNLACRLMRKTKIYEALLGVRGRQPVPLKQLEEILVKFSRLITENRRIKECDINPLLASENEIIALDARIVLHDATLSDEELPTLAIRPYPENYIHTIHLKDGREVVLRPIRPEDENLLIDFHQALSEDSVRQRYFEFVRLDERITHERLLRICFNDYDREWGIVAEIEKGDKRKIIGIGRLTRLPETDIAHLKLVIIDSYQHLHLGTQLLQHLLKIAQEEKINQIHAYILAENQGMLKICQRLGFSLQTEKDPLIIHAQWKSNV
jgi:acetyltransferase